VDSVTCSRCGFTLEEGRAVPPAPAAGATLGWLARNSDGSVKFSLKQPERHPYRGYWFGETWTVPATHPLYPLAPQSWDDDPVEVKWLAPVPEKSYGERFGDMLREAIAAQHSPVPAKARERATNKMMDYWKRNTGCIPEPTFWRGMADALASAGLLAGEPAGKPGGGA
jgi:hypothetical protein